MKFYSLTIAILVLFAVKGNSQSKSDSLFLNYLVENSLNNETITFINSLKLADTTRFYQINDLYFKKGMAFYAIKSLDSAAISLSKVPLFSTHKIQSNFFEGLSNSYLQKVEKAKINFLDVKSADSLLNATRNFELASLALFSRNRKDFDRLSAEFSQNYYQIQKQQDNLLNYKKSIDLMKRKSPFKAAVLSAIVPGLGKLYVGGQLGQGISTFLQNAVMGIQAVEAYKKAGPKSARFIIYGGLFSVFYLGNIWGSALSVSIKRQEFNEKINDQILFDMHIPLRALFN